MKIHLARTLKIGFLLALFLYSAGLLGMDLTGPQENVRGYFADIECGTDYPMRSIRFFGINTSINVLLFACITVLFAISLVCSDTAGDNRRRTWYCAAQVLFFAGLLLDERLQLHEKAGYLLGIEDALILLAFGFVQLAILFGLGSIHRARRDYQLYLFLAGVLFSLMVVVDGLWPNEMPGRLALEDLSKTWASVALFGYAWRFCMGRIFSLRARAAKQHLQPA